MAGYLLRRFWHMVLTLFAMATLMFFLFRLLPGDPTATVISPSLYPKAQEAMRQQFGLDRPLFEQYLLYLRNLCVLDFGFSFQTNRPVFEMIQGRLLNTILLILPSMLAAYLLGAVIGAIAAWKRGGATEVSLVFTATALQSAPLFWLGMLAILLSRSSSTCSRSATSSRRGCSPSRTGGCISPPTSCTTSRCPSWSTRSTSFAFRCC